MTLKMDADLDALREEFERQRGRQRHRERDLSKLGWKPAEKEPQAREERSNLARRTLRDYVNETGSAVVDTNDSRIRGAPTVEQRNLVPIAQGGGFGIAALLEAAGIDSLKQTQAFLALFDIDASGPNTISVTNFVETRTIDATTATASDIANLLGTLFNDLRLIYESGLD